MAKIPQTLWAKTLGFFFDSAKRHRMASVIIGMIDRGSCRRDEAEYSIWVPSQVGTSASVKVDSTAPIVNLITGEVLPQWEDQAPGQNRMFFFGEAFHQGSMPAFFSGTTETHALSKNGNYFVVGDINPDKDETFKVVAAYTAKGKLKPFDPALWLGPEAMTIKPDYNYQFKVWTVIKNYFTEDQPCN